MKNLLLVTLLAIAIIQPAYAQVSKKEYSPTFEEPQKGWYKVMQLSNGNTFFLNFDHKEGLKITVYNPERRVASKRVLKNDIWEPKKMKSSTMEGIYEIDGNLVIFLQQLIGYVPILYRIQLDPTNGSIKEKKEIARLPKYPKGAGYAMAFGNVDQEDFIVEKDPYSDAYAVLGYNSFAKETNKRFELVHYNIENGEHVEITRAFYDAQGFKYTNYVGMSISHDKTVHMAAYGYNTKATGGKDSRVIISSISKGESSFKNMNIEFTDDFKKTEGMMIYNPKTGMIQLLTITYLEAKRNVGYYNSLVSYIDPTSLQIVKTTELPIGTLNNYIKSKDEGIEYEGLPVNMILNNDNTSTILCEDKRENYINSSSTQVQFGRIGVIRLDNSGKDTRAYTVVKKQIATGQPMEYLYHAKRGKGTWSYIAHRGAAMYTPSDNRPFYSFDYISTNTDNTYIIFNDNIENYKTGEPIARYDKYRAIKGVSESIAMYRKVSESKIEHGYVFGKPVKKNQNTFCNVEAADFDRATNIYATLIVKRDGRSKKARIAWITFE